MASGSGIDFTVHFESAALEATLDRLIRGGENLRQPMADIAAAMLEETHNRFDTERSPLGVPWEKSRRAMEDGGKTLTESGQLRNSIEKDHGADFAQVGVMPGPALLRDDASVRDYAPIHQFGGVIRPKTKKALKFGARVVAQVVMPARPYLGFGKAEEGHVSDILAEFIQGLADGSKHP